MFYRSRHAVRQGRGLGAFAEIFCIYVGFQASKLQFQRLYIFIDALEEDPRLGGKKLPCAKNGKDKAAQSR
jgi:hypothetical protein